MYWYVLELCGGVSEICVLPNTAGKLLWEFVSKKGYLASRIFPVSLFLQVSSLAAMLKTNLLVKMFLGSSFAKVLWPDCMKNALKWVATSVMLDGKQDFIYMALSLLWHSFDIVSNWSILLTNGGTFVICHNVTKQSYQFVCIKTTSLCYSLPK